MKKILYYLSLVSNVIFLIMISMIFPIIIDSSWQGKLFLIVTIIYIISKLVIIVYRKEWLKNTMIYNFLSLLLMAYLGVFFTKIMIISATSSVYLIDKAYCCNNLLLLSIVTICMILNGLVFMFIEEE